MASVLLAEKDNTTTALFICPAFANEVYRDDLRTLIDKCEINSRLWDIGHIAHD